MSHDPIAYAYDADIHCPSCALARFGDSLDLPDTVDSEANSISAGFSWDDSPPLGQYCGDCSEEISAPWEPEITVTVPDDPAQVGCETEEQIESFRDMLEDRMRDEYGPRNVHAVTLPARILEVDATRGGEDDHRLACAVMALAKSTHTEWLATLKGSANETVGE